MHCFGRFGNRPHSPLQKSFATRWTPGRADFWILKMAHAPSPENLPKNSFCPLKGVAVLTKAVFEKNFQVRERIPAIRTLS
jgi:hypothetical protein